MSRTRSLGSGSILRRVLDSVPSNLAILACGIACLVGGGASFAGDWPMLAHDAGRSGATGDEIRPPFERSWYRIFANEGLHAGVQPVVAGNRLYIGTLAGVFRALDSRTGEDAWSFQAGGAILAAAAVAGDTVAFACANGEIYGLATEDGKVRWRVSTPYAVWNAPLVVEANYFIGGRDGVLRSIVARTGTVTWEADTGAPILSSPAADLERGRIYAASEDLRVRAFELESGHEVWRSPRLAGVTFRGYHPVVAPDGSVLVTTAPAVGGDEMTATIEGVVRDVFGDWASWRHTPEENDRIRRENFRRLAESDALSAQLDRIGKRCEDQPFLRTFFVLDRETGEERIKPPIIYAESMNGTAAPPIVPSRGRVVVKFRALLRSRYEHYSPFLNVGWLDPRTGAIAPVMDQSRTYGWHESLLLVHDEQSQLAAAGDVLINTHQNDINALDLETLSGYAEPFARNIHEPSPGEALAIALAHARGDTLPPGKEWLVRGTAVYGGGSAIDTSIVISGDSFFWVPTHELNSGSALIAYREAREDAPRESGAPGPRTLLRPPSDSDLGRVSTLPWDFDVLETPRLSRLVDGVPAVLGTRRRPDTQGAFSALESLREGDLDRIVWEEPRWSPPAGGVPPRLREALEEAVREVISADWRPLIFPAGKHPRESYVFFADPLDTLDVLGRALPHLSAALARDVVSFVEARAGDDGPFHDPFAEVHLSVDIGRVRSRYDPPPTDRLRIVEDVRREGIARLAPAFLFARSSGNFAPLERRSREIRSLLRDELEEGSAIDREPDWGNGRIAGLIASARLAWRSEDRESAERAAELARETMRKRLERELAHSRGGLLEPVPVGRTILGRWRNLGPEVGRLLATHARGIHARFLRSMIDHHRPTWWIAWGIETMWRNECPFELPTVAPEVFAARSWILGDSGDSLARHIDLPWCRADLFHIEKLVHAIERSGSVTWHDVRTE